MQGFGVGCGEVAGGDGVDLNTVWCPLVGEGFSELGDTAFGSGVGRHADASLEAEEAGYVDDFAASVAGDDVAGGELRELEDAGEIDLEDVLPGFERGRLGGVAVDGAGVVDQNVDAAEGVVDLLEEVFGAGGGAEVGAERGGLRADGLGRFQGGATVAMAGYGGSGLGESDSDGGTEAAGGAGDEGDFAVKAEGIEDRFHAGSEYRKRVRCCGSMGGRLFRGMNAALSDGGCGAVLEDDDG